ncbi:hypothetical protein FRC03_000377 [Tulasnella sp. 419]|nr:hypothetical protein FRC03_000377 [Tulasnella sp. 419]
MFWSKFKRLWARIFRRVDESPVATSINHKVDDGPTDVVSGQPVKGTTEVRVAGSHSDSLQPTAQKVMQRFRILLLGKSGAGKSSLIENIMKIPEIDVARYRAGDADINMELKSDENPHFVLHDSMGYESGSREHFQVVKDFIEKRSKEPEISEQIHAIWLCTKVQSTGGRIFETGDETLLQMNLGRVPLIIVFTQYDELVDHEELQLLQKPSLNQNANDNAEKQFDLTCIRPLKEICKRNRRDTPPHLKVSVRPNYENTLQKLAQLTKETLGSGDNQVDACQPTTSIKSHGPVWITWAMAQRVDADLNLEASIA